MEDIYFDYTDFYNPIEDLLGWKLIVGMVGENIFLANHKPYTIKPGSVLLIKPFEYAFPVLRNDSFQYRCYTFDQVNCSVLHSISLYTYLQLSEEIVERNCTLLHILAACTEPEHLLRKTVRPILPPVPRNALTEIHTQMPNSVKEWATKIGVSDKTLETHFHHTLNILPGAYLRNTKYCHFTAKNPLYLRKKLAIM